MAFDHVTFFEVHVDGTAFGSPFGGTDETDAEDEATADVEATAADAERPGAGRKRRYVAFLGVVAVGSVVARRLRRRRAAGEAADVDVGISEPGEAAHEEPLEQ